MDPFAPPPPPTPPTYAVQTLDIELETQVIRDLLTLLPSAQDEWSEPPASIPFLHTMMSSVVVVLQHVKQVLASNTLVLACDLFGLVTEYMEVTTRLDLFLAFVKLRTSMTRGELLQLASSLSSIEWLGKRLCVNLLGNVYASRAAARSNTRASGGSN